MQEKKNLKVIFLFECPCDKPLEKINIVDKYMLENDINVNDFKMLNASRR